jgi:cysteine desulfurase
MRSGTLSVPLILGFTAALKVALEEEPILSKRLRKFQQKIESSLPEAIVYGAESPRGAHVSCLGMPGVPSELQLMAFDLKGIAVSTGSACSSGKMKGSHVLAAMGVGLQDAQGVIRVSTGWKTQEEDIDTFIQTWKDIYAKPLLKEAS